MSFKQITDRVADLLEKKNAAYGGSYAKTGEILGILFPQGVQPNQYQDMLVITRMLDKLGRIANDPSAFQEDPWMDLAGYAILQIFLKSNSLK